MIFFHLPDEIKFHVLSFLSPEDLTYSFDLDSLHYCEKDNRYRQIQHMALLQKYNEERIIITNNHSFDIIQPLQLSPIQLQYFIRNKIVIKPKDYSFILFNIDSEPSMAQFAAYINNYLWYLKLCTNVFNFLLVLLGSKLINDTHIHKFLSPLGKFEINRFTIKYHPGSKKPKTAFPQEALPEKYTRITVRNLKLHLFNCNELLSHLNCDKKCYMCDNLTSLDLSYNNIDDTSLSEITFPVSLKCLNLSDNNITSLNRTNFKLGSAQQLEILNLSNNNIMRISYPECTELKKLNSLNLSGNQITNLEFLQSSILKHVKILNISRNMITQLHLFPINCRKINLSRNYINQEQLLKIALFPKVLQELNLSWCRISYNFKESKKFVNKVTGDSPCIKKLELYGNNVRIASPHGILNIYRN